jgi:ABC-2 type transport system ATP-binding protein
VSAETRDVRAAVAPGASKSSSGSPPGVPVMSTHNLIKNYGKIEALKGVTLTVNKGEIFGLLGQNGAGKTTLVKIMLGITKLSYGSAELLDEAVGRSKVLTRVGYLPEDHRFPEYHSAFSLLDFYGSLLEMPRARRRQRIPEMLEMVGLKGRMHYKIRTYSKGMKQRVGIAQALMHDPDIIFLDEPTDGVDPVGRKEIRAILHRLKEEGKTIFINSHLLGEVELICDRVVIMQRGEIIRQGDMANLTKSRGYYLIGLASRQSLPHDDRVKLAQDQVSTNKAEQQRQNFPVEELQKLGYRVSRDGDLWEVALDEGQTIDPVVDLIHERGLKLRHLSEKRQSLEDLFIQTVEAAEPGVDEPTRRRRPK